MLNTPVRSRMPITATRTVRSRRAQLALFFLRLAMASAP